MPLDQFHKHPGWKDGHRNYCKICSKNNYQLNREEILSRNKDWSLRNKEKHAALKKQWKLANPEKVRAQDRKQKSLHRDKINEQYRKRYSNNPVHYLNLKKELRKKPEYKLKSLSTRLSQTYKIDLETYNQTLFRQKNLCAICNKEEKIIDRRNNTTRKLAIDHCHKTNKFRGLLCGRCNMAIGLMNESIEVLKSAYEYLKKHQEATQ